MDKRCVRVAACAAIVLSLCACRQKRGAEDGAGGAREDEAVTISLGFSTNMDDPRGIASLLFKEEVERNSNGRITVDIRPDGSDAELIEGVIGGTVDMAVSSAGNFAVYATRLGISAMPFLFGDFESAWRFMDSDIVADVNKTLEDFNIVVLSHYDNGFRCVTTSSRPVNTVDDMKGLNIRTPPNQIVMETMSALGANPRQYDFPKLKQALRAGLFDSQENPIPVIYNSKLFEEQKFLAVTNHSYDAMPLVIRKDLWDGMSAESRKILSDAAKRAQDADRELVKSQTESYVDLLREAGMTVTTPNVREFARATDGVMDTFATVYGAELIARMREATKQ